MKKIKFKYIALAASLATITLIYSCKKFLDKAPVGSLSASTLANKAGVDGLLIGAYSMLDGMTSAGGTGWESGVDNWTYGGIASDDAYKGSNTTDQGTAAPLENHSVDPSNEYLSEKWSAWYACVARANNTIQEVPLVKDGSLSAGDAAEVIAEARFIRGVGHLELAKVFRNVPYASDSVTYSAGNYNLGNPGPIWDKIEDDFTAAMTVLPKTQSEIGRANYYADEAFLALTYMYDHQYDKAMPLLNDLITNGTTSSGAKYALGAYEDNFNASTKNGPESVFAVQMSVSDGSNGYNDNGGEALNFPAGTYTSCCGFYQPSYTLGNAFKVDANGLPMFQIDPGTGFPYYNDVNLKNDHGLLATDPFTPATDALDPRIDWTLGRRGIPYLDWGLCGGETWSRGDIVPYNPIKNVFWHAQQAATSDNYAGWATNQGVANNYNMIRFSEVILWRAECEVEANLLDAAQADVNTVRTRMQNPAYWVHTYVDNSNPSKGFTTTPAANYQIGLYGTPASTGFTANGQAYARAAVYMETQLETGMEGKRFFDLQRWDGLYGGPAGAGYMAGVLNAYIKADTRISNPVLNGHTFTAGKNELFPIPQGQIDVEAGPLKQNPGY
ncbi:MAG TPA: RagB/SusD family nutrient uptake outer membrane protein [Hanamia sp.]